ncbi:MAG: T9SS type A sorting domain-containing protein [Phycisphaerae bacterium]|nr:T9SS type A sorting domain-containing protein [Saprospiraceae bacterium]
MFRKLSLMALLAGIFCLAAFRSDPFSYERPFAFNSTIDHLFWEEEHAAPVSMNETVAAEADSLNGLRVMMLNSFAYDSAYANKVQRVIQRRMPSSAFTEFWDGSSDDLSTALTGQDAVVVAYPSGGSPELIRAFGKVLGQFARLGGAVILTGTHEFGALQQLGLFDLDYGYYCKERSIGQILSEHPVFQGVGNDFSTEVYQYPLDISDPGFVALAEVRGYPFMGYKQIGAGKVVYLGLEYYFDEPQSSRLLTNVLRWVAKPRVKRSEVVLYAGKGFEKPNTFDLKIYPNPYVSKATLDIDITKPTSMAVDMTDELGRQVTVLLPRRNLSTGLYRLELPNLEPGVYLVQCQSSEGTVVRKVVKAADN